MVVLDLAKVMIDLNDYLPIELLFVDFVCLMFDVAAMHLLVNLRVETFSAFVVYLIDSTLIIFYANAEKFDFLLPGYSLLKTLKRTEKYKHFNPISLHITYVYFETKLQFN